MHGRGTALNPPELIDFVLVLFFSRKCQLDAFRTVTAVLCHAASQPQASPLLGRTDT